MPRLSERDTPTTASEPGFTVLKIEPGPRGRRAVGAASSEMII